MKRRDHALKMPALKMHDMTLLALPLLVLPLLGLPLLSPPVAAAEKPLVTASPAILYNEECGGCHLAYPPRLLPGVSWQANMRGLNDHFGENAELDAETATQILQYLNDNSADQRSQRAKARMDKQLQKLGHVPLRITELPWFERQHDEIPRRMTLDNPKLGSFSRCDACHQEADRGKFNEHRVSIPGFGRWRD